MKAIPNSVYFMIQWLQRGGTMDLQTITNFLIEYKWFLLAGVLLLIVLVFFNVRSIRKRKIRRQFEALEVRYNELSSVPILFKINKATGLAKINPSVDTQVVECKALFNDINKGHETITHIMQELEDALAYNKLKESKLLLRDLEEHVEQASNMTQDLSVRLEKLLEKETEQRMEITALKETFRNLKSEASKSENLLGDAFSTVEEQIHRIEHHFSVFEEWMYASDFEKAQKVNEDVKEEVDSLKLRINMIPKLYEVAKGQIPGHLDETSKLYQTVRQNGVYLDHLEVPKNLATLTEVLRSDLLNLANGDVEKVESSLNESKKRLEQLSAQISKEDKAHSEVLTLTKEVFEIVDSLNEKIEAVKLEAPKVERRFNFENCVETAETFDKHIKDFMDVKSKISRMVEEEKIPATTILISIHELGQDVSMVKRDFEAFKEKMNQANADELRARNQLMKLYLIINDVQVRIHRRSLPYISDKYESDVKTAQNYTHQIAQFLEEEVIDVNVLNATVDEAIDYTYKLHNNVNNLVGAVDMCENAIVYANKFRAYVPDIDAELTRAELSFQNGEYTQALTTVINAIDRYRPNSAYEEMIRNNAKSAR